MYYGNKRENIQNKHRKKEKNEEKYKLVEQIVDAIVTGDMVKLTKPDNILEEFAKKNKEINMTQLRKFFNNLNNIKIESYGNPNESVSKFMLLLPFVKYAKARNLVDDSFVFLFEKFSEQLLEMKTPKDKAQAIKNFQEAMKYLIAYSKYYGEKK